MRQGGANSFFRFVLGFTLFIALSFGITYAVTTYSIAQEREKQVSAAFQTMIGSTAEDSTLWEFWK
jgi:hypothetical protein